MQLLLWALVQVSSGPAAGTCSKAGLLVRGAGWNWQANIGRAHEHLTMVGKYGPRANKQGSYDSKDPLLFTMIMPTCLSY